MPIPEPKAGESRDEFISRCMSAQEGEDRPQDQKFAICFSQWRDVKKGLFDRVVMNWNISKDTHG